MVFEVKKGRACDTLRQKLQIQLSIVNQRRNEISEAYDFEHKANIDFRQAILKQQDATAQADSAKFEYKRLYKNEKKKVKVVIGIVVAAEILKRIFSGSF